MARPKANTSTEQHQDIQDSAAALVVQAQKEAGERLAQVITQFGEGMPFDVLRYEDKIRGHLSRSAEEMLAAGRALVVAREHLPHGEWLPFMDRLGLDVRLAQRMMQSAVRFSNASTSTHLIQAAGSKSKVFELMILDDEEIQELNEGGTVAGLDLDEIARMPVSELRKALRDIREEKKAVDQLLTEKGKAVDNLKVELQKTSKRIKTMSPDETAKDLSLALSGYAHSAEHAIHGELRPAIEALMQHDQEHGTDHRAQVAGLVAQVQQVLDELRAEFALGTVTYQQPAWAGDGGGETPTTPVPDWAKEN